MEPVTIWFCPEGFEIPHARWKEESCIGRGTNDRTDVEYRALPASAYAELVRERNELREALAFYASERNWTPDVVDNGVGNQPIPGSSEIELCDRGQRARAALKVAP